MNRFAQIFIFLLLLIFSFNACAEFEMKDISARVTGLGGAFIALADDPAAIYYNPAGVALNYRRELISSYTRLYGLDELIHQYIGITTPVLPLANLGFGVERFGTGKYQENKYTLAIAREIFENQQIGFSVNSFHSSIADTDDHQAKGIDFGIISKIGKYSRIAFSAINLTHPFVNEQLDSYYRLGFLFKPTKKLKLLFDFEKPQTVIKEDKVITHIGQELEISDGVFFRLGYHNRPERLSFGFGFETGNIKIDYAYLSHVDLDATHQVSMGIKF